MVQRAEIDPKEAAAPEAAGGPTPAERARTLAYGMADGVLVAPGVPYAPVPAHTTDLDGRPLLLLPASSPIVAALAGEPDDLPATLRISDVAPVPLPDRVRGRAWLHGWLAEVPAAELRAAALRLSRPHPRPELLDLGAPVPPQRGADADADEGGAWTILALEVAQVEIDDAWGSATLEPEEYAAAAPDPFVAVEAGMLTHLDSCHRAELTGLLPEAVVSDIERAEPREDVRPLALDRHGLWLRCRMPCTDGSVSCDLRLPFPEPVRDIHGLRQAYRTLFTRANP